ncbi:methyltransferase, FkbM family [Marinibacterium anthonyi]|nr:methyltransferase, FkbM family [Marinibacterium anthonyi]
MKPTDGPDFPHFIAHNANGSYCVPDLFAGREVPGVLAAGGIYEPRTLERLRELSSGGDIVTGGAFVGDFLPFLGRCLAPGAQIISFEPHPLTWKAAQHTLWLNGLDRVTVHNVAVGEKADVLPLRLSRPDGTPMAAASRLAPDAAQAAGDPSNDKVVNVDVVPLDDLVGTDRAVSVLHLDVEGHEEPALRGAARILQRCRPAVVLECAGPKRSGGFLAVLGQLAPEAGYAISDVIEGEGNVVFLPNPA